MKKIVLGIGIGLQVLAGLAESYAVPVLGDLHYDKLEHHDMPWVREKYAKDLSQIENYSRVTREYTPGLLQRVEADAARRSEAVPFVIQLGDFTEGLCGSRELQATQFHDAFTLVQATLSRRFFPIRGNHDVTGPGAREAGDDAFLPYVAQALGREGAYNYTVWQGRDLFVFWESMTPDMEWLARELEAGREARHIFLATHYPVLPYNYRAHWGVFAQKPEMAAQRQALLELLERHRVIVLSAHLHQLSLVERVTPNGSIVQVSLASVVTRPGDTPANELDGVAAYRVELAAERNAETPDLPLRQSLIAEQQPLTTRFYRADFNGFGVLEVEDTHVRLAVYNCIDPEPVKILELR